MSVSLTGPGTRTRPPTSSITKTFGQGVPALNTTLSTPIVMASSSNQAITGAIDAARRQQRGCIRRAEANELVRSLYRRTSRRRVGQVGLVGSFGPRPARPKTYPVSATARRPMVFGGGQIGSIGRPASGCSVCRPTPTATIRGDNTCFSGLGGVNCQNQNINALATFMGARASPGAGRYFMSKAAAPLPARPLTSMPIPSR